ncbi:carboxypeptidase-like regulatory domain-containing protein [Polyangium sorediatum]|uniref:Carboxypeptidase-like regulatory domain-containing protein n=1 Tax=Polyangium sorediatum TaxID=889274 RepID=A0ABT6NW19_9BACT|nr:carboxypeptidase-like regulatory domain-containing protein [Polyangium sorediatum]MDI1432532.1 carboxypeptidase-like regulatory domain-containing protein [Polyangium sorediatum]
MHRSMLLQFGWTLVCASLIGVAGCGPAGGESSGSGANGQGGDAGSGGNGGNNPSGTGGMGQGGGGGGECTDQCSAGQTQCSNTQLQTCALQANGCYDWSTPQSCPTFQTCSGGQCASSCTDQCSAGETQCSGANVQSCALQANGCYDWNPAQACPTFQTCSAGQCALACTDTCSNGGTQCANGQIQTCGLQVNGCYDWNPAQNCPTFQTCNGGQCVSSCSDQCMGGATQCSGPQVQTCGLQANGCYDWNPGASCPSGQACEAGACASQCDDKCTQGQTKCSGTQVQSCAMQPTGCYDWAAPMACPSPQICQGSACASSTCVQNDLRCNGNLLEVCNGSNQWQTQQVCAQACDPAMKACTGTTTCVAGSRRCNGLQTQVCNSTGTAWLTVETCAIACDSGSGLCAGSCEAGEKRCNGNTPETCNPTGTAWTQGQTCGTYCFNGDCAQPSLVIDANANATLNGEQVFAGDVTIINSSVLTVPSGKLVIRAKNFVLDASSQIVVTPTGNDPRGKGGNGGASSCNAQGYCTASGTLPAGGGGYGVAGATTSATFSCYYSGTRYCSVSAQGGPVYAIADQDPATGSSGGTCTSGTPGLGGGMLVIYAENITIAGQVTVNGQSASGCAGGGSGGGVVLRATNDLKFTGSISTAGGNGGSSGGGNGGNGAVKLLYGNSKTLTGSVVASKFESYMAPFDVSSSTHPSSNLWYNDGYPSFELAWSKPFTASAGYYYKLNTAYGFVPNSSNASYKPEESVLYTPADLAVGTNYFHISTLGPFANFGTVESRFVVNINATTPTVSSSSHTTPSTWYTNNSPYFAWTLPKADENTKNFYWEFDPYATTMPDHDSNTIPMDLTSPQNSKQILLPGKANGIWFFHLIAEDTMGNLTKNATHFRVQIGTDPGKGSVSGTVTDAMTGQFVSGASITLNRGMHDGTTNASGGFAFANAVFAQQYEVRVSKAGYQDMVKMVTVTSGQTSTVNFAIQQ